jgi:hypothetical protein
MMGHRGPRSLGNVHSPYRLLAGENIGSRFVVPTVAGCVDIVAHLDTEHDGGRIP